MLDFTELFTRIGRMAKLIADQQSQAAVVLPSGVQNVVEQYPDDNDMRYIEGIEAQLSSAQTSSMSVAGFLQGAAVATINGMVYEDNPLFSNTNISLSLAEVIRQMIADSQTVKRSVVSTTVTAASGNQGDGVCVASVYGADGRMQENSFAENMLVKCTFDSVSGAVAGQERFTAFGTQFYSAFDYRYPAGSGGSSSLTAIDASQDGALLTNGDFEDFTSNTPDNWTVTVGSAGTNLLESNEFYTGEHSVEFVGNGSTLTAIEQEFGEDTAGTLSSETQYAINCWIKVDVVPAAGVLEIALTDGSSILEDEQGVQCKITKTLSAATTSWVAFNGAVRTPYILPDQTFIRVRLSTALSTGSSLFVDRLSMAAMTQVYAGGPSVAVFSGASNFYVPDYFTVAVANDRGGSSNSKSFQVVFERFFSMRQLGLLLPSSLTPSLPDNLIS